MDSKIQGAHLQQLPKFPNKRVSSNGLQTNSANFSNLLQQKMAETPPLKISKHAEKRLLERGITIDTSMWKIINEKVREAKSKGVQDSLVITENAALVVSAKNSTVITAMDREEAKTQIFTNINGTILL